MFITHDLPYDIQCRQKFLFKVDNLDYPSSAKTLIENGISRVRMSGTRTSPLPSCVILNLMEILWFHWGPPWNVILHYQQNNCRDVFEYLNGQTCSDSFDTLSPGKFTVRCTTNTPGFDLLCFTNYDEERRLQEKKTCREFVIKC